MKKVKVFIVGILAASIFVFGNVTFAIKVNKNEKINMDTVENILEVKNSQIDIGSEWSLAENFVKVTTSDGKELVWKDIEKEISMVITDESGNQESKMKTDKENVFNVTYNYKDNNQVAKVEVTDKKSPGINREKTIDGNKKKQVEVLQKVPTIELKETTIGVGDKWTPSNNFVKVVMTDGTELNWSSVEKEINVIGDPGTNIVGQVVNTDKVGVYNVSYLYQGQIALTKVTVVDKKGARNKKYYPNTPKKYYLRLEKI